MLPASSLQDNWDIDTLSASWIHTFSNVKQHQFNGLSANYEIHISLYQHSETWGISSWLIHTFSNKISSWWFTRLLLSDHEVNLSCSRDFSSVTRILIEYISLDGVKHNVWNLRTVPDIKKGLKKIVLSITNYIICYHVSAYSLSYKAVSVIVFFLGIMLYLLRWWSLKGFTHCLSSHSFLRSPSLGNIFI